MRIGQFPRFGVSFMMALVLLLVTTSTWYLFAVLDSLQYVKDCGVGVILALSVMDLVTKIVFLGLYFFALDVMG